MHESPGKPITLKMVAARVACSISLVSTVLNHARGNSNVSDRTRARILEAAQEMGYRPNFASQALKTRRSRTLGIYVQPAHWRRLGQPYEMDIFQGIEVAATRAGYDLLVLNMSCQTAPEVCLERMLEGRIDGILLIHADRRADWIDRLAASTDRVVAIDCCMDNPQLGRIVYDNAAAIDLAVGHLARLGHRRIAFIEVCETVAARESPDRETPYRDAIRRRGLDDDPALVVNGASLGVALRPEDDYCQIEGAAGMQRLLELPVPPTAVVAYNSLTGFYALREAERRGVSVPETLSVIGVDDIDWLKHHKPRLTCIDHPLTPMGEAGAELLIEMIEGRTPLPVCRTFSPRLIAADTCAAPPAP